MVKSGKLRKRVVIYLKLTLYYHFFALFLVNQSEVKVEKNGKKHEIKWLTLKVSKLI